MKKTPRTVLILLAAVLLAGACLLLLRVRVQTAGRRAYEAARELTAPEALSPSETDALSGKLLSLDLAALQKVNPDAAGWLLIPGTEISYPLLQGRSNDFYLSHTWDGRRGSPGALFLDFRNDPGLEDFNTLVYGHALRDGAMFGSLADYRTPGFREAHPSVYLVLPGEVRRYEIFTAGELPLSGPAFLPGLREEADRQALLDAVLPGAFPEAGPAPTAEDRLLTLATCAERGYGSRWAVQAVLREIDAAPD